MIKYNGQADMNERFSFKQNGLLTMQLKLFLVKVKTGCCSYCTAEAKSLHGQRMPLHLQMSGLKAKPVNKYPMPPHDLAGLVLGKTSY